MSDYPKITAILEESAALEKDRRQHVEEFAEQHAEQWLGCIACGCSHHKTAFCPKCGRCYFLAQQFDNTPYGDFVTCQCGHRDMWD